MTKAFICGTGTWNVIYRMRIMYALGWPTIYAVTSVILVFISRVAKQQYKHHTNTNSSPWQYVHHFILRHNEPIPDHKRRFSQIDSVSHSLCSGSAEDVTFDSWWRLKCILQSKFRAETVSIDKQLFESARVLTLWLVIESICIR